MAFYNIFGNVFGTILNVFIAVSCLGTLNGLMIGCTRGLYAIAVRKEGPKPEMFSVVDPATNMPANAAIFGLLVTAAWLLYFYLANLSGSFVAQYDAATANGFIKMIGTLDPESGMISINWFGFDSSEIPIVSVYALYLPIFFKMITFKEFSVFKRIVMPIFAIICSLFMIYATLYAHKWGVAFYLIVFAIIMTIGGLLKGKQVE